MKTKIYIIISITILLALITWALIHFLRPGKDNDFYQNRQDMVDNQIIARGIEDRTVIEVMRKVPRHKFVKPDQ